MQQWLSLFVQCAVPVFKTLATVKTSETVSQLPSKLSHNLTQTQQMLAFLSNFDQADKGKASGLTFADAEQSAAMQTFVQTVRWAMQQQHLDFQQWRWRQEKVWTGAAIGRLSLPGRRLDGGYLSLATPGGIADVAFPASRTDSGH